MEIATGLMMTGMALYQEVEQPVGQVGIFSPEGDNEFAAEVAEMIAEIAQTFEMYETAEIRRGSEDREAMQVAMRQTAQRYESEEEEEEELQ